MGFQYVIIWIKL